MKKKLLMLLVLIFGFSIFDTTQQKAARSVGVPEVESDTCPTNLMPYEVYFHIVMSGGSTRYTKYEHCTGPREREKIRQYRLLSGKQRVEKAKKYKSFIWGTIGTIIAAILVICIYIKSWFSEKKKKE